MTIDEFIQAITGMKGAAIQPRAPYTKMRGIRFGARCPIEHLYWKRTGRDVQVTTAANALGLSPTARDAIMGAADYETWPRPVVYPFLPPTLRSRMKKALAL